MIMYIFMTSSIGSSRGRQGMSGVWWNHEMHISMSTVGDNQALIIIFLLSYQSIQEVFSLSMNNMHNPRNPSQSRRQLALTNLQLRTNLIKTMLSI